MFIGIVGRFDTEIAVHDVPRDFEFLVLHSQQSVYLAL